MPITCEPSPCGPDRRGPEGRLRISADRLIGPPPPRRLSGGIAPRVSPGATLCKRLELIEKTGFVFETTQIEKDTAGFNPADDRDRQRAQSPGECLDGSAGAVP